MHQQSPAWTPAGTSIPPVAATDFASFTALSEALRHSVRRLLPENAMLREDRGDGLYITDALRRAPDCGAISELAHAGFETLALPSGGGMGVAGSEEADTARARPALVAIRPGVAWLGALAAACPDPPDALCASLMRFNTAAESESLALFAQGVKARSARALPRRRESFDRALRQRAAVCLREGGGGGLNACALLLALPQMRNDSYGSHDRKRKQDP